MLIGITPFKAVTISKTVLVRGYSGTGDIKNVGHRIAIKYLIISWFIIIVYQ